MKKCLIPLIVLLLQASAQAQFFGGYADGVTILPTGKNSPIGPALRMVYDDFTFGIAGDINGFGIVGRNNTGSPVAISWEIRTGMSAGNAGTLVSSGNSPSAVFSPLPENGAFGTPQAGAGQYGLYEGGPLTNIHLDAGTYWIGLAPLEQFGSFDVTSTAGLGSVGYPINNGNAFYYDSSNPSANYISMGANDFSLMIYTLANTTVPEPGALTVLALTAVGLHRRTPWTVRRPCF